MSTKFSYSQSVDWLMQQLPMFAKQGKKALNPSLDNILALCEALGNPQMQFKSIHIAGTNGKGSTSHILAAVFQMAGYKTGLYTSPHLTDIRERFRINGATVSEAFIIDFIHNHRQLIETVQPSYFELNVAMAFMAFAAAKVDIAVIETGLGGRWDSTNIITPELSVITNISLDHTQILGKTIEKIATSKAGIIKPGIPVVIGESQAASDAVFFKEAILQQSIVYHADALYDIAFIKRNKKSQELKIINKATREIFDIETDLTGDFQWKNIVTAYSAIQILVSLGWQLSESVFKQAIKNVKIITGLRGRWDWIQQEPNVILDVAHNPAGMKNIQQQLNHENLKDSHKHIVIGFVADKDVPEVLQLLPKNATYYFTQATVPRALSYEKLTAFGLAQDLNGQGFATIESAVNQAFENAQAQDTILITGSFFIVGAALAFLDHKN